MGTIQVNCAGLVCDKEISLDLPDGWHGDGYVDQQDVYCDDCKLQGDWRSAVCPGCVGSFFGCSLCQAFAYERSRGLTEREFATMRGGVCPFRTNGTFSVTTPSNEIDDLDISDKATSESSEAMANAIKAYDREYIHKEPK